MACATPMTFRTAKTVRTMEQRRKWQLTVWSCWRNAVDFCWRTAKTNFAAIRIRLWVALALPRRHNYQTNAFAGGAP